MLSGQPLRASVAAAAVNLSQLILVGGAMSDMCLNHFKPTFPTWIILNLVVIT